MKKALIILLAAVMALTAFGLTACGGKKEEEEVNTFIVYDLSNPADVTLEVKGNPKSIFEVRVGTAVINKDNYTYSGGKLTIKKEKMGTVANANKLIRIVANQGDDPIEYRLVTATKIITDCNAFQNISENLNGVYVLGADLDFADYGNFNPIGNNGKKNDKTGNIGLDFTGTLIGAGHTISNLTANADLFTDDEIYTFYGDDGTGIDVPPESHYEFIRPCFGIFMRNAGTIEDVCFKNCVVRDTVGTIMGLVVAVNEGKIENVLIDGGEVIGGPIWLDYNCFVAGFAGINGGNAKIINCISTVKTITANESGDLARAFCGKTWGKLENCYACGDGITLHDLATSYVEQSPTNVQGIIGSDTAPELGAATGYGFTYTATETSAHTVLGSFEGCAVKTMEGLKDATLYAKYDTSIWSISSGEAAEGATATAATIPSLKVLYSAAAK